MPEKEPTAAELKAARILIGKYIRKFADPKNMKRSSEDCRRAAMASAEARRRNRENRKKKT